MVKNKHGSLFFAPFSVPSYIHRNRTKSNRNLSQSLIEINQKSTSTNSTMLHIFTRRAPRPESPRRRFASSPLSSRAAAALFVNPVPPSPEAGAT